MGYVENIRKQIGNNPIFMPCAAGVIFKDNKILLQKRKDDGTWAVHGGSLELGESFLDALKRELKEELNIDVKKVQHVSCYSGKTMHHVYPNGDEVYCVVDVYIITDYDGEISPDKEELEEVEWFDVDKLPQNLHKIDILPIQDTISFAKKYKII